jgi:hypothetical protein
MSARDEQLERGLSELTRWEGEAPGLWRRALEQARAEGAPEPRRWRVIPRTAPMRLSAGLGLAAALALLVTIPAVILPTLGKARSSAPQDRHTARFAESAGSERFAEVLRSRVDPSAVLQPTTDGRGVSALERQVVHRITLEIAVPDVRTAYLRAANAVSPARGEFVAESSLRGEGAAARASLTLRVAADRLSAALEELRALGEVISEQARGEDVTDQLVDLDARLRNEQRVEEELLRLMESRDDAPLKDVLELREQLGRVRVQIERLAAQRERLDRLVALATVLVIISPEDPDKGAALWDGFTGALGQSWRRGVEALIASLGWIVSVLVGGLVWWVLLAIALAALRRWYWRRAPAPGVA